MAPNPSTNVQLDVAVDREREPLLSDFVTVAVPPDSDRLITKACKNIALNLIIQPNKNSFLCSTGIEQNSFNVQTEGTEP